MDPVPCIIDTDPGVDDILALLLALASPELLVLSIVLTHGNTPLSSTLINLRKMFYALERHLDQRPEERGRWPGVDMALRKRWGASKILVVLGPHSPIAGEPVTAAHFHGRDGLSNVDVRHPDLTPPEDWEASQPFYTVSPEPLVSALPALLQTQPLSTIAYLAIGPLTGLALLHELDPTNSILYHFAVIFVMGGAVDVPGNTTPVAEFNIFADPYAAQAIFALCLPHLHILPLDITSPHTLPFSLYSSLVDSTFHNTSRPSLPVHKSPLVHFTSSFLEYTRERMVHFGADSMELHDPTVVWALVDWSRGGTALTTEELVSTTDESGVSPSAEMRKRIEKNGFTRRVVERRRSSDLVLWARLEGEREKERLTKVMELSPGQEEGTGKFESIKADEKDKLGNILAGSTDGENNDGNERGWYDDEKLAPGWEWQWREFDVETTGSLTRGMMVSDRRQLSSAAVQITSHQTNRAIAEEIEAADDGSQAPPLSPTSTGKAGTKVVVATPGGDTLRALLLERVWGVIVGLP